jgi:adenylosuccinate lyase
MSPIAANAPATRRRPCRFWKNQRRGGSYNAHLAAYPEVDWPAMAKSFVEDWGSRGIPIPQIQPHDYMPSCSMPGAVQHHPDRFQPGCLELHLARLLQAEVVKGEVGSSTMPHKVNPIDFEMPRGQLWSTANALFRHLAEKLPVSRFQRDLTDSTVLRNLGVAFGYMLLAGDSCLKGIGKLEVNAGRLEQDLDQNWEVLAEAVQTVMRRYGVEQAYEKLKDLTRGKGGITRDSIQDFVRSLNIPDAAKKRLLTLTPASYTGNAATQARNLARTKH